MRKIFEIVASKDGSEWDLIFTYEAKDEEALSELCFGLCKKGQEEKKVGFLVKAINEKAAFEQVERVKPTPKGLMDDKFMTHHYFIL